MLHVLAVGEGQGRSERNEILHRKYMERIKRLQGPVRIASIGNRPKRPIRDRPREPLAASAEAREGGPL
jgi:hypothetical protein